MFRNKRKKDVYADEQAAVEALKQLLQKRFPNEVYSDYPPPGGRDYLTALVQLLEEEQKKGTKIGRSLTKEGLVNRLSVLRYIAREKQRGIDY